MFNLFASRRKVLATLALIALPLTGAVAQDAAKPAAKRLDVGKGKVEGPAKDLLAAAAAVKADNPRVEPGKVHWHESFAAACEAARQSKKPVLLFQMLGKLDQQFC